MKKIFFTLFFGFSFTQLHAFDQQKVSDHMMKFWNLDSRDKLAVSTPVASQFKELKVATVTIRNNPYPVYFTSDEKYYFWGNPMDLSIDPDKSRMENIRLKRVHSKGSPNAPVTIVEFFNFQCLHCRHANETLEKELYKTFTKDQVRWVAKNFPFDQSEWAEPAAIAAECAAQQKDEAYWDMADLIFSTNTIDQKNLKQNVMGFAKKLNLNTKKFEKCFDGKETIEKVRADKMEGKKLGVSSTPTFFINGRLKRGFNNFEDIKVVIEEKLKQKN